LVTWFCSDPNGSRRRAVVVDESANVIRDLGSWPWERDGLYYPVSAIVGAPTGYLVAGWLGSNDAWIGTFLFSSHGTPDDDPTGSRTSIVDGWFGPELVCHDRICLGALFSDLGWGRQPWGAALVSTEGDLLHRPIALGDAARPSSGADVAWNGRSFVYCWQDSDAAWTKRTIHAALFDPSGNLVRGKGGASSLDVETFAWPGSSWAISTPPLVARTADGEVAIVYSRPDAAQPKLSERLYVRYLRESPALP